MLSGCLGVGEAVGGAAGSDDVAAEGEAVHDGRAEQVRLAGAAIADQTQRQSFADPLAGRQGADAARVFPWRSGNDLASVLGHRPLISPRPA